MLLFAFLWAFHGIQILGNHFENLEELPTNKLDLVQVVFDYLSYPSRLYLYILVLFFDKLKPWAHVAKLLEDISISIRVAHALTVRPAAHCPLAYRQVTGSMKLALIRNTLPLSSCFEVLKHLIKDHQHGFACISLLVPIKLVTSEHLSQHSLLQL